MVAMTSMARHFDAGRGRALTALGARVSEAVLPVAVVVAIAAFGWRHTYAINALLVLVVPGVWWLLAGHAAQHRADAAQMAHDERQAPTTAPPSWTRRRVLASPAFYLLVTGILTHSLVITALFFHHLALADMKAWSHA